MRNILIIELENPSNILKYSKIETYDLRTQKRHLLTDLRYKPISEIATDFNEIYYIDVEKIKNILQSKLVDDVFALKTLVENLDAVKNKSWDKVINISNSTFSKSITSLLQTETFIGKKYNQDLTSNFSDIKSKITDYLSENYQIARRNSVSVHFENQLENTKKTIHVKIDPEFNDVSATNINKLRGSENKKILAFHLDGVQSINDTLFKTIFYSIFTNAEDKSYQAIVILNHGDKQHKEIGKELAAHFGSSLAMVTTDLLALPSLLNNIDFIVTKSPLVVSICDAINAKSIFVIDYINYDLLTVLEGNTIIQWRDDSNEDDIWQAIYSTVNDKLYTPANTVQIFTSKSQDNAIVYQLLYHSEENFYNEIFSIYLAHLESNFDVQTLLKKVNQLKTKFSKEIVQNWVMSEREHLNLAVKSTLATIREIRLMKTTTSHNPESFISCLDNLIKASDNNSLVATPVCYFKKQIENISTINKNESLNKIEEHLYELKNNFQTLISIYSELTKQEFYSGATKSLDI